MPRCATLPHVGVQVSGAVIWHADHNHQVKTKLTEWIQHEDLLPQLADRIGRIAIGHVTKLAPIGVLVRLAHCIEGAPPPCRTVRRTPRRLRASRPRGPGDPGESLRRRPRTAPDHPVSQLGAIQPAVTSAPPMTPAQRSHPTPALAAGRSCGARPGRGDAQPPRPGPRR